MLLPGSSSLQCKCWAGQEHSQLLLAKVTSRELPSKDWIWKKGKTLFSYSVNSQLPVVTNLVNFRTLCYFLEYILEFIVQIMSEQNTKAIIHLNSLSWEEKNIYTYHSVAFPNGKCRFCSHLSQQLKYRKSWHQ